MANFLNALSPKAAVVTALSRRRFLGGVAVAAMPTTAKATELATAAELPIDAAERLSAELSEVMNEYLGGKFHAVVYPSAQHERPVVFVRTRMQTAQERFDYHLAELKKAAEELDPMIGHWHQSGAPKPSDDAPCALVLTAFRTTGQYQGDGFYERKSSVSGHVTRYNVRLLEARIDDQRLFEVTCPGDKMQMLESRLNTFVGRRVA